MVVSVVGRDGGDVVEGDVERRMCCGEKCDDLKKEEVVEGVVVVVM